MRWTTAKPGLRIAAIAAGYDNQLEASLASIERDIARARRRGAQLIVLPECAVGGYLRPAEVSLQPATAAPDAVRLDGPELARLMQAAGDAVVCVGVTEDDPAGPFSTAVCLTGTGILGTQRKVHLPPGERGVFVAGAGFAAFDTPVGRLGMIVCYDKCFPEAARTLALDGAHVVASLAAWGLSRPAGPVRADPQTRQFNQLDEVRAVENQVVWVSTNQCGRVGRRRFLGHAKVISPDGTVLARTRGRSGVASASVAVGEAIAEARGPISHLTDRQAHAYRVGADVAPPADPRPAPGRDPAPREPWALPSPLAPSPAEAGPSPGAF